MAIPYILTREKKKSGAAILREKLKDGKLRIVPEIYDCMSAKAAEMNGFEIIMVSSGELACALTGIPDLQLLSIDDFVRVTEQITRMTAMPLIVDADDGFGLGRALNTQYGCMRIMKAGAAGVLVTDTAELGRKGQLNISDACLRFQAARSGLDANGENGYLIARCDSDMLHDFTDCVERCKAYIDAGADMLCVLWMHKIPSRRLKLECCAKLRDALSAYGEKYRNFPMWYPDLCGKTHDPYEVSFAELEELGCYQLAGAHFSGHAAMLAMLDVGRHVLKDKSNDYVDEHFDDTGYKTFTTMSMFGLTDGTWVEAENAFVRTPQDSIAQRNADYFVREGDVHNPDLG